ncbi:hypothetical protein ACIGXI_34645 [Kitasatospora aureofaciens]|uniref:hypothetical protein n=1 Tax=Kitasatospora aureofaciens TaxID=1894 RepID=UPI0037C7DDF1
MTHRTHRPVPRRQRARRRFLQRLGQAVIYTGTTTLVAGLARALLHLVHLA